MRRTDALMSAEDAVSCCWPLDLHWWRNTEWAPQRNVVGCWSYWWWTWFWTCVVYIYIYIIVSSWVLVYDELRCIMNHEYACCMFIVGLSSWVKVLIRLDVAHQDWQLNLRGGVGRKPDDGWRRYFTRKQASRVQCPALFIYVLSMIKSINTTVQHLLLFCCWYCCKWVSGVTIVASKSRHKNEFLVAWFQSDRSCCGAQYSLFIAYETWCWFAAFEASFDAIARNCTPENEAPRLCLALHQQDYRLSFIYF